MGCLTCGDEAQAAPASSMALAVAVSAGRGYSCPAFAYAVSAADVATPKLCGALVITVRDPFEENGSSGSGDAPRPAVAAAEDDDDDEEEEAVYEAHVASPWLVWLAPPSATPQVQPAVALPAVVNTTRLADDAAEVPYLQAPFSILKAALGIRLVFCIRRAHITVEGGPVGSYVAWCVPQRRQYALVDTHASVKERERESVCVCVCV
jgi:hypothetical protein